MKNICFTGHRNLPADITSLTAALDAQLIELIEKGAENFYAGGALGWDMLCEREVLKLRKIYPQIKLHLLLPCPFSVQTSKWNPRNRAFYEKICEFSDSVTVLSDRYHKTCMKDRNQALVDRADCCVCFYDESNYISGTGQTVRMASNKGIEIINLF